jgi:tagatose 1,6-diphosphate aldolase
VLLSAGVDYPDYFKQVEMAMDAGASGVLGGRAFWKEYFQQKGEAAQREFARGECVKRVRQVDEVVQKKGRPWFERYGLTMDQLHKVRAVENWHFEYSETGEPTGPARPRGQAPAPKPSKDQVY